ncbi:uncharacterized protein DUF1376 [Paraburkholderia caballeronis]|uniref:DUF1376 domain-containing protein n=1 Tax=Paraburkholderia caballeronis TaxID=416943 RepID=UPI001066B7E3|nr:DUF1376 domain-containing protein [Paraburkholderia caballeronis]TDV39550.1 uncharacterized protein DUF1376 [Paraburkholderia caballeronis]
MTAIPYPPDTRAKGWRFELDYERIRQSDTWALAASEIRPWLLMLWMTAWEQTPCGSLPDDDELIAARIGMSLDQFQATKKRLMRGWWLAEDGRLYHGTMVERVLEMIDRRDGERIRKANQRARKGAERASADAGTQPDCPEDSAHVPDMSHGTDAGQQRDSHGTDDTGTGTGTGSKPKPGGSSDGVGTPRVRDENAPLAAAEISASLREWERGRGKAVRNLTPSQQQVIDLAEAGPTAAELRRAYELAVEDRDNAEDPAPVNAGFIRSKLERVRRLPLARASPGSQRSYHDDRADVIAQLTGRKPAHQPATDGVVDVDDNANHPRLDT